ncbi:33170_t:CDS:2 [Gigaspora margarita]|uniref:33170_t:CDS:1 n=1 Tax=Gigaspora margarita TaxID=4874 RepID=A0ABN7VDY1_GIGMA|nr:33170_t:CDS:2 [Gigaspora margarita]
MNKPDGYLQGGQELYYRECHTPLPANQHFSDRSYKDYDQPQQVWSSDLIPINKYRALLLITNEKPPSSIQQMQRFSPLIQQIQGSPSSNQQIQGSPLPNQQIQGWLKDWYFTKEYQRSFNQYTISRSIVFLTKLFTTVLNITKFSN